MENAFNANSEALRTGLNTEATRELRHLLLRVASGQLISDAVLERAAGNVWWDLALPEGF